MTASRSPPTGMRDLSSAIRFCSSSSMQRALRRLPQRTRRGRVDADGGLQRRRAVHRQERPLRQRLAHVPPCVERRDDLPGYVLLHRDERIVGGRRAFDPCGPARPGPRPEPSSDWHRRSSSYCSRSGCSCCIHSADGRVDQRANHRLRECAIEREIDLGNPGSGREPALVGRIVAAERADVVERPRLAAHHPIAGRRDRGWPCPRPCSRTRPRRDRAAAYRSGRYCWRTRRAPFWRRRRKRRCRDGRSSHGSCRRSSGRRSGSRRRPRRDRESIRAPAGAA